MDKIILWGMGEEYQKRRKSILFEEMLGNITIVGGISKNDISIYKAIDNITIINIL